MPEDSYDIDALLDLVERDAPPAVGMLLNALWIQIETMQDRLAALEPSAPVVYSPYETDLPPSLAVDTKGHVSI